MRESAQSEDGTREAGPPLKARPRLLVAAVGVAVFLSAAALSRAPGIVERVYATGPGPWIVRLLSTVSAVFPFALAELFVVGFLGLQITRAALWVRAARTGRSTWTRTGVGVGLGFVRDAGLLLALFYPLWGFNYSRAPLEHRLGWSDQGTPTSEELSLLAIEAVSATNAVYLELHGVADSGEPTPMPGDWTELELGLAAGWARLDEELGLGGALVGSYGRSKTLFAGWFMDKLGIMGMFFPFTGEPLVNDNPPAVLIPKSIAHEQAHQRGYAPEDEANFMGVMAGVRSPDPLVRYAAASWLQRRFLADVGRHDPDAQAVLLPRRLPGVVRDERDLADYVRSLQGPVNAVADRVNDAYLHANRVEGGILSYGMATRLLVEFARERGGALGLGPTESPDDPDRSDEPDSAPGPGAGSPAPPAR